MSLPTNVRYYENDAYDILFKQVMNSVGAGGVFDVSMLPDDVKERLVVVADTTAMLALTLAKVQNGDVVQVGEADFYMVVDQTKLSSMAGYVLLKSSSVVEAEHALLADAATTAGSCTGNAATATALAAVVKINGVDFDGSAAISAPGFAIGAVAPDHSMLWINTTAAPTVVQHWVTDAWVTILTSAE